MSVISSSPESSHWNLSVEGTQQRAPTRPVKNAFDDLPIGLIPLPIRLQFHPPRVAPNAFPGIKPFWLFSSAGHESAEIVKAIDSFEIGIRWGDFYARRLIESLGIADLCGIIRVTTPLRKWTNSSNISIRGYLARSKTL
jgi:hypothetical protein